MENAEKNNELLKLEHLRKAVQLHKQGTARLKEFKEKTGDSRKAQEAESWGTQGEVAVRLMVSNNQVRFQERRVWRLVIGWDESPIVASFSLLLLVYNVLRYWFTIYVADLREYEERTHYSPEWKEYRWMWRMHQGLSLILLVSIGSALYRYVDMLFFTTVLIPG